MVFSACLCSLKRAPIPLQALGEPYLPSALSRQGMLATAAGMTITAAGAIPHQEHLDPDNPADQIFYSNTEVRGEKGVFLSFLIREILAEDEP